MSGLIIPGQPHRSTIALQTRKGWDIENSQSFDTSLWEEHQLAEHKGKYPRAEFRTGAIPVFNCHGLTFASRRSGISDTRAISRILEDDHYERISREDVSAGDIILYVSGEDGDFEHSGVITDAPKPPLFVPKVWSKWGFGAEVIHFANDCPYD